MNTETESYAANRARHLEAWGSALPDHLDRLGWHGERLATEQDRALRALVSTAREKSRWHQARLQGVDVTSLSARDLSGLPTMTKDDVMEHFDDVVTDQRVNLEAAEAHLARLRDDDYFDGDLHVVASGGSSGRRGVFVYGWSAWVDVHLGLARRMIADRLATTSATDGPVSIALVAASNATHMTAAVGRTFTNPLVDVHQLPVALPVTDIVDGLNAVQPVILTTYSSMLAVLAHEATQGRLNIAPGRIITTSEPLLPEIRSAAETVFRAPVANCWAASEAGVMAVGCWHGSGMHLNEDLVLVEAVDAEGNPTPPGTPSEKVFVTNLFNTAMPLIRYELTDEVTMLDGDCPCGSAYRRIADVQGRVDDAFTYGQTTVHPHVLRSALSRHPTITEYQVRQTADGANVTVCSASELNETDLAMELSAALHAAGLPHPRVTVHVKQHIGRDPSTGKLKRFLPLSASPAPSPP